MDPNSSTILRVKRKRSTDPADALLLACKRIRPEGNEQQSPGETVPEPEEVEVEKTVFKLVATVSSQDAPVQTQVCEALARPRVAHALRPSATSSQRIMGDLRSTKWSTRRDERYRILSSHRAGLPAERTAPASSPDPDPVQPVAQIDVQGWGKQVGLRGLEADWKLGQVQVFDLIQEEAEPQDKDSSKMMTSDPEGILCNSVKMIREHLTVSGEGLGAEHRETEDDYVYDLYYQETTTPGWIQDILSVRVYTDEGELVPDLVVHEEEVYEDEDDENEEGNWRNDYPDEDSDEGGDREERYGGYWEEEHSYSRRSWEAYQREILHQLGNPNNEEEDDDQDSD